MRYEGKPPDSSLVKGGNQITAWLSVSRPTGVRAHYIYSSAVCASKGTYSTITRLVPECTSAACWLHGPLLAGRCWLNSQTAVAQLCVQSYQYHDSLVVYSISPVCLLRVRETRTGVCMCARAFSEGGGVVGRWSVCSVQCLRGGFGFSWTGRQCRQAARARLVTC